MFEDPESNFRRAAARSKHSNLRFTLRQYLLFARLEPGSR